MSLFDDLAGPARQALDRFLADPSRALVATDFDGTISPLVDDPEAAGADPRAVAGLVALAEAGAHVAIITGRPVHTAVRLGRFGEHPALKRLVVLGQYGVERWDAATGQFDLPEDPPAVREFAVKLPQLLADAGWPDLHVEDKGRAVGVHTRRASDPAAAMEAIRGPVAELAELLGLRLEPGHNILEVRARGVDKGDALRALVAESAAETVVFCGDDLGDLPAFEAVRSLRSDESSGDPGVAGFSVAVAADADHPVVEKADLVVPDVSAVADLFTALAAKAGE